MGTLPAGGFLCQTQLHVNVTGFVILDLDIFNPPSLSIRYANGSRHLKIGWHQDVICPFCAYFSALGLMKASNRKSPCNLAHFMNLIIRAACFMNVCLKAEAEWYNLRQVLPKTWWHPTDAVGLSMGVELHCWADGKSSNSPSSLISSRHVTWSDKVKTECT